MSGKMILSVVSIALCLLMQVKAKADSESKMLLKHGWSIQSSARVRDSGDALSRPGASTSGWYSASMPSTVMAALVSHEVYPDPYFGKNLQSWPGTWPKQFDTSAYSMPPGSPFLKSWWYRTEFDLPADNKGKTIWLHFDGINYSANIWLNGKQIADPGKVAGPFRMYEFDVTDLAAPGKTNALAVEIIPPGKRDLAFSFVDWNPAPPDRDMGIWRDVYITASGPVALRHPHVVSDLDLPGMKKAHLTVTVDAKNATSKKVTGTIKGKIGKIKISKDVELGPNETKAVTFLPKDFPQLNISSPKLWWPYHLGEQNLYDLELEFLTESKISDTASTRFGIREITSEIIEGDWLLFRLNGEKLLVRGAGWTPDMMLRYSPERYEAELRYVKEMNLNVIRLEGKLEAGDLFYELCDEMGILVMPGWCCCNQWERWSKWDEEDYIVSEASQRDQIKRLRSHPSLIAWLNGSDNPPPPDVEQTYLDVLEECMWPNPSVSSAAAKPTDLTGPSGMKMTGPYEYVPPSYWYLDTKRGGAFGFTGEIGPGPAPPPVESLELFIPEDHLWPIDGYWEFHAGRGLFADLDVFNNGLYRRYGKAKDVHDYAMKAQAMTYDGMRGMYEAYARNKFESTGVIHWMLNNAWPGIIWHQYDYFLRPGGGYYGTMKACEPLHVQYSYDDRSIVVVNSFFKGFKGMAVTAEVYNLDMTEKFSKTKRLDIPSNSSVRVFSIPEISGLTTTYFLKLDLEDSRGKLVSTNFYWLSTRPVEFRWRLSYFSHTPVKQEADLTGLNDLEEVELEAEMKTGRDGKMGYAQVFLSNPTPFLAFMVHVKVTKGKGGEEILPVFWEDNYFPLMPGETRTIRVEYRLKDLGDTKPFLEVEGWNVKKIF